MSGWLWRSPYKVLPNPIPHWEVKWVQVVICLLCKLFFLVNITGIWYKCTCFLQVISHCERKHHPDIHRFEKISNIIKQFKLSCSKLAATFQGMEVSNKNFSAFIDVFTSNTYVMVVMSDPTIRKYCNLVWNTLLLFINTCIDMKKK